VIRPGRPSPAVLEIDGVAWRTAGPADAPALEALAARSSNRILFNLPESETAFANGVGRAGLRWPMLCLRGSKPVGAAATKLRNQRSLNVHLICFFADPLRAALPLAVYVRHLFWSLPLHRIYCQLPLVGGATSYVRLLRGAGFHEEGVIRGYAIAGGRPRDLAVLGVLREEFEIWCRENEKRLAL
jgi:hypothetical protein